MKKQALLAAMASALIMSYPLGAQANDSVRTIERETVRVAENVKADAPVSSDAFIQAALDVLTYQHGSKEMRKEIAERWTGDAEVSSKKEITNGDISKILIRALGIEEKEETTSDYLKSAQIHKLLKVYSQADETVTAEEMESILENAKQYMLKGINDKGVSDYGHRNVPSLPSFLPPSDNKCTRKRQAFTTTYLCIINEHTNRCDIVYTEVFFYDSLSKDTGTTR